MSDANLIEIWKPVKGWEGVYSISNLGKLRRDISGGSRAYAGKILSGTINDDGYVCMKLCYMGRVAGPKLHALVAQAFISDRPHGMEVNHKNLDKKDNRVVNLEWITHAENVAHANSHGVRNMSMKGERNPRAKITEDDVRAIRRLVASGMTKIDVAKQFRVNDSMVGRIYFRTAWSHVLSDT